MGWDIFGARSRRAPAAVAAALLVGAAALPATSIALPAGMEYEKVTPGPEEKGDAGMLAQRSLVRSSPDGRRLTFQTPAAFPGSRGAAVANQVINSLSEEGWSSRGITPPFDPDDAGAVLDVQIGYQEFSDDLTRGVVMQGDPPLAPGALEDMRNLFIRDLPTGGYRLVTPPPVSGTIADGPLGGLLYAPVVADVTPDLSHIVYETSLVGLTANAPFGLSADPSGVRSAYEWADGQTRLVGILPEGTPAPDGAVIGRGVAGGAFPVQNHHHFNDGAMSDDGSRIFFTTPGSASSAGATGDVYVRENGDVTKAVSRSQRVPLDPDGPRRAKFLMATKDGGAAFFTSCEKLTGDATASDPDNTGCDGATAINNLYRYDVASGQLTDMSVGTASVVATIGSDSAGRIVYFVTDTPVGRDIHVSRDGVVEQVATGMPGAEGAASLVVDSTSRQSIVSLDGRYLAFATSAPQGSFDTGGVAQLYLYDGRDRVLRCVTCSRSNPTYRVRLRLDVGALFLRTYEPRNIDVDARFVVFETRSALVAEDVNDKVDVYRYNIAEGQIELVSTGLGDFDQNFAEMSADGRSIFFVTQEQVIPDLDEDLLADVYVARTGARKHVAPVRPLPCSGEECQGPLPTLPDVGVGGSAIFSGPGTIDDQAAPRLLAVFRVAPITRAQQRAWARTGRLRLAVRISSRTRVTARVRGKVGSRQREIARASKSAAGGGTVFLTLRLSAAARRQLRSTGRLRVTVAVSSSAGGPAERTTVTLLRAARSGPRPNARGGSR